MDKNAKIFIFHLNKIAGICIVEVGHYGILKQALCMALLVKPIYMNNSHSNVIFFSWLKVGEKVRKLNNLSFALDIVLFGGY